MSEDNVANSTIKYESIDSASNEPVTIQPQQTVQQSVEPEDVQIKGAFFRNLKTSFFENFDVTSLNIMLGSVQSAY